MTSTERWRKWRATHERIRSAQKYHRGGYQRRIAEGRCGHCGERLPADLPFVTCDECRADVRQANKNRRNAPRLPREESRERIPGCRICGLRGDHICLKGNATERKAWV